MATQKTLHEVNRLDLDTLGETIEALRGDPELGRCRFKISNKWTGAASNCSTVTSFYAAKQDFDHTHQFELRADEAGKGKGRKGRLPLALRHGALRPILIFGVGPSF